MPALNPLQQIQTYGHTQTSAATPLDPYKIIIGTFTDRIDKPNTSFCEIM